MIRTSVLETVKSNQDISRLIENGLLKSLDEIPDVAARAEKILKHRCDERCRIRVGSGNSEKDFQCRKMHSVKDSPDPTKHCYIPIQYKFQKTTKDVLKEIGIFTPI